jgi:tRNA dimethylallyltransferase
LTSAQGADTIKVPVILGPTAVGKTDLAMQLSCDLDMEIISCDSRQIYRGMDIGTAKPGAEQLRRVKHWLVDIVDPDTEYSCFRFSKDASAIIRQRAEAGIPTLLCGGSGLYFKSLFSGLGPEVGGSEEIRRKYWEQARMLGDQSVFDELARVDPCTAAGSHPSNVKRNIRALEVYHTTGETLSELKKQARGPVDIEFLVVVCGMPRHELYQRINQRVDVMVKNGLMDEFKRLRERGHDGSAPGMQCVGYKELFAVEKNESDFNQAIEKIKQDTRNYAKRQITWFRHQVDGHEIDMRQGPLIDLKKRIKDFIKIL